MQNQKLALQDCNKFTKPQFVNSISLIPLKKEFNQNYIIFRVKLTAIEISQETRNDLLKALSKSKRFMQIDDYTIMLNAIASIEPLSLKNKKDAIKKQNKLDKINMMKSKFEKG